MNEIIVDSLADQGWCVVPDFVDTATIAALRSECLAAHAQGGFHAAGVGSGQARVLSEVRGDHIRWLEEEVAGAAGKAVLARLESLRRAINQELLLGLLDLEIHFAAYPVGAAYQRHLDRFRDDDRRTVTVILYLNADWGDDDGGVLRFWPDETGEPIDILPTGGTLVTFLSQRFWHEVLPTRRQRLSLTGWFRRR